MLTWLSLDTYLVLLLSGGYLLSLFVVAYKGQSQPAQKWFSRPWVYSLSLGVSCTSWAFYGTVGQAATTGAWLTPIYFGSILCFMLAWPMLLKMLRISKQQNITSIADFIACRYGRSPTIAATVTLVALVGTVPYIALQLRAISNSFDLSTGNYQSGVNTAVVVTLVLIAFSILFGTRQAAINKQNQGLVLAIAFSSWVKLLALSAVGIFACFYVMDQIEPLTIGVDDLAAQQSPGYWYFAVTQAILGMITIFILPQQYHMMVIENHHEKELKAARWLYPLYLLLINVFILPIALTGQNLFPGGAVDADTFVLTIPLYFEQSWLVALAYIGGLAAATGMVIVATVVLSTMVTTEIINPLLLRYNLFMGEQKNQMSGMLLNIRRGAVALLLLLALAFERMFSQQDHLASIGLLSFVLLAQLAPAVVAALYWRKATTVGALTGLALGSLLWFYCLLLPSLMPEANWVSSGPLGIAWLKPQALFGLSIIDSTSHGLFYSLLSNILSFALISILTHRSVAERLQADVFLNKQQTTTKSRLTNRDLYQLLQRFVGTDAADRFIHSYKQTNSRENELPEPEEYTRLQLSSVLGSASTRMVMKAAGKKQKMPLEDVVDIVDEASELFQFNRELLQAGIENIEQGISVIDADMRLVAWNQRYIELLDYPEDIVTVGKPIAELIRYNAQRGMIADEGTEDFCERRLQFMRSGSAHHLQREMPNGLVIEIRGQAMPGGGFVSTFSDITAHIEAEKALKLANETLEQRVQARTEELALAKAEAEAAHLSKSRFLAAASHDLMQPFNAAHLFTNMLNKKLQHSEHAELSNNLLNALNASESLLTDLVEIAQLDRSNLKVNSSRFCVDQLLATLGHEFGLMAQQSGIRFRYLRSNCYINTDQRLLRRVVQNFLSNAINYCAKQNGRVVLGVRRRPEHIRIEVWDNGPGIAADQQQSIFAEFERLEQTSHKSGLGLGLAISERIAKLLGLTISLKSTLSKGSCFSITIAKDSNQASHPSDDDTGKVEKPLQEFNGLKAILIDNDAMVLNALRSQLQDWGCTVLSGKDESAISANLGESPAFEPNIILSDYHLDNDQNGVDLATGLLTANHWQIPVIICSADPSEQVREHTRSSGFYFMRKPVKALALKKLIRQVLK